MTTEATAAPTIEPPPKPLPADPRAICRATPAELHEFAELRKLADSRLTDEQIVRYAALERIICGGYGSKYLPSVLASALAVALEQDDRYTLSEIEFADRILGLRAESKPLPLLFILPSGKAVNLEGFRESVEAYQVTDDAGVPRPPTFALEFERGYCVQLTDPHDVAAIRARLHRLGTEIEAPTLKGDDADGDGRTGE